MHWSYPVEYYNYEEPYEDISVHKDCDVRHLHGHTDQDRPTPDSSRIPKKWTVILTHIGKSQKLFPKNGRWLRGYPGNYFQVNFMSTYPWKNNFPKNGSWLRGFSGNLFQYLEKVSRNSPGSLPEFTKFQISFKNHRFWKKFPKIPWVKPQNR